MAGNAWGMMMTDDHDANVFWERLHQRHISNYLASGGTQEQAEAEWQEAVTEPWLHFVPSIDLLGHDVTEAEAAVIEAERQQDWNYFPSVLRERYDNQRNQK